MGWLQGQGWVVGVIVAAAVAGQAGLVSAVDLAFAATVRITLAVGWAAALWLPGRLHIAASNRLKAIQFSHVS